MKRILLAVLAALALVVGVAAPANAYTYGKPSGRWFEAIVAHEVGHCLGWAEHNIPASTSIMRPGQDVAKIMSGAHTYKPTSLDLATMQASRANYVAGERATAYVTYPTVRDYVPVYNRTGRTAAFTAANRWDPYTSINIVSVGAEPSAGITIKWDSSLAGTNTAGVAVADRFEWNGAFWQIADCTVRINTNVVS